MYCRSPKLRMLLPQLILALTMSSAMAVVLDWDTTTYTPGSLNEGFDLDNTRAGNEVTFVITGNTNKLRPDAGTGIATPSASSSLQGGLGQNSLNITANVGTQTEITVTVTFSALYVQGVENVSFVLFDIDKTTDSEFIKDISATTVDGTVIPATITNLGSSVTLSPGGGLGQVLTGQSPAANADGAGNATISFGANVIRSFTFTFDNSSGPPRLQEIGMHDLNFTPVPEINPALAGALSCVAATGLMFFHRARVKSRRQ